MRTPLDPAKGFAVTLRHLFRKPVTEQYPEYKRPVYPRFRGRHRLHRHENGLEKCIGCGNCVRACKEDNGVSKEPFYFRTWVERYHVAEGEIEHPEVDSPNGGHDAPPPPTEHLNIKVTDNNNEVFFKIKRSTKLEKLMNAFCERQGKQLSTVRFLFDGQRVRPEDSPDTVSASN
jgi:small ubiquitin-related modifier